MGNIGSISGRLFPSSGACGQRLDLRKSDRRKRHCQRSGTLCRLRTRCGSVSRLFEGIDQISGLQIRGIDDDLRREVLELFDAARLHALKLDHDNA